VPLRWDAATDRYVEIGWDQAFSEIGAHLRKLDPKSVVFYSSGRASLETSYMYQLLARMYGNNNLPDSSNMCHESTSVALPKTIGVPIGTVVLDDFEKTDCILLLRPERGHQQPAHAAPAAGSPQARRAHHHLQSAARARPGQLHQSAVAAGDAERGRDTDQHPVPPAEGRRRHGRADGPVQGRPRRGRRGAQARRPARARHRLHAEHTHGLGAFKEKVRDQLERDRAGVRPRSRRPARAPPASTWHRRP
jgi:hypothetical protein